MNKCVGCLDIMHQQQQTTKGSSQIIANLQSYKPIDIKPKASTIILKPQEKTEKRNINKKLSNSYNDHNNKKKWGMKRSNQPGSFAQNLPN